MSDTAPNDMTGKSGKRLSLKFIYVAIVILILGGFGYYCYYKISQWTRFYAIETTELPIPDYCIKKIYKEETKLHRDDDEKKEPNYYLDVTYHDKDYHLTIDESTYEKYNNNPSDIKVYYDEEGDDVFLGGTGGQNLFVIFLTAIILVLVAVFFLIRFIIRFFKPGRQQNKDKTQAKGSQ